MRSDLPWWGVNRETLRGRLDRHGCDSAAYDETEPPLALYDWDNTVVKNDVGDAITFYRIKQGKVLQPPNQNWKLVSKFMTDEAAAALTAACGTTVAAGQPLPTNTDLDCADENGNISAVARTMDKVRPQVQRWLARYGLDARSYRKGSGRAP